MIMRALTQDGDWTFGKGRNNYVSANAAVAENIQTRLLSFLGDCFFDLGAGLDWFTYLGSIGPNVELALQLAVSAVILNTGDVISLVQLSVDLNRTTRKITIQYQVQTTYSTSLTNIVQVQI